MIHSNIRHRLLIPLGLAMAFVATVIVISFYHYTRHELRHELESEAARIETLLQLGVDDKAALLLSRIELLEMTPCVQQAFAERLRTALLDCTSPLFERMRENHQITHMYFHRPDRVNFLRVHYPPRYGDVIERLTMIEASTTGKPSHGIELGPLGQFTLRTVKPVHVNDVLLGYIELGMEIHHITPQIKDILHTDLLLLIGKQHLTQRLWEEGQRLLGRSSDWEQLRRFAIIDRTTELWAPALEELLVDPVHNNSPFKSIAFSQDDRHYESYRLPLKDASGRQLGYILSIKDTTEALADIRLLSVRVSSLGLIVAGLLFAAFGIYLRRIQDTLTTTHSELVSALKEHEQAELRLHDNQIELDHEIEQRKRAAAEEHTLGVLLRLSLQQIPMENFLEQAITALVTTVPWLSLMPKGGVFLSHGGNEEKRLELVAEYNLSAHTILACSTVAFGTCLCGQAAASGKLIFAGEVDERHAIRSPDMQPHGHYNIPIKHNDSVLGVIVLYLRPGYRSASQDREFLERVASVFSMGILRRYGEEALVEARQKAEAASKAKSNFLATMSHEIRTPLNGVLGMTDLLLDTGLNEEQREFATVISQSGRNLLGIINDILDFSKGEAERLELSPIPFNLETTIHDVVELLSAQVQHKQLDIIMDYAADCPQYLLADAGRIRQIMLNLIGNAIKFTQQGHILIKVTGQLEDDEDWAALYVSIEDSGIGFKPEDANQLFDAFSQADASTTRRFGGTGLGLAICKQLVELMGGEIGAVGDPGKGSKFWFALTLPLAAPPQPLPKAALEDVPTLLIDANTLGHTILCRQLEGLGLRLSSACEQEQALTLLHNAAEAGEPFQLVLIDHPLPHLDIDELARCIQADQSLADTPLILLTSLAYRGDALHFEQTGFAGYLTKPIQLTVLCRTLSAALATGRRLERKSPLITRHCIAEDSAVRIPYGRILVVDDNESNRKVACSVLQHLDVEIDAVASGQEAISRVAAGYDLILMDLQMPEMDGYQASRLIREGECNAGRRTPIIALTASTEEDVRAECEAAGMDDSITKPFDAERLRKTVQKWLSIQPAI